MFDKLRHAAGDFKEQKEQVQAVDDKPDVVVAATVSAKPATQPDADFGEVATPIMEQDDRHHTESMRVFSGMRSELTQMSGRLGDLYDLIRRELYKPQTKVQKRDEKLGAHDPWKEDGKEAAQSSNSGGLLAALATALGAKAIWEKLRGKVPNPDGKPTRNGPPGRNPTRTGPGGNPTRTGPGGNPTRTGPGGNPTRTGPGGNPTRTGPGGNPPINRRNPPVGPGSDPNRSTSGNTGGDSGDAKPKGRFARAGAAISDKFNNARGGGRLGTILGVGTAAAAGAYAFFSSDDGTVTDEKMYSYPEKDMQRDRQTAGQERMAGEELAEFRRQTTLSHNMIPHPVTGLPLSMLQHRAVQSGHYTVEEAIRTTNEEMYDVLTASGVPYVAYTPTTDPELLLAMRSVNKPDSVSAATGDNYLLAGAAIGGAGYAAYKTHQWNQNRKAGTVPGAGDTRTPIGGTRTPVLGTGTPVGGTRTPVGGAPSSISSTATPYKFSAESARANYVNINTPANSLVASNSRVPTSTSSAPDVGADASKRSRLAKQIKAAPILGTALTAFELHSIYSDKNTTTMQKHDAATDVAGGTIGAIAGAKAGATGGAALGAGVGALFFGAGAAPGALIGGALGALGGGVAGFLGGEYASKKLKDKFGWFRDKPDEVSATQPGHQPSEAQIVADAKRSGKAMVDGTGPKIERETRAAINTALNVPQVSNVRQGSNAGVFTNNSYGGNTIAAYAAPSTTGSAPPLLMRAPGTASTPSTASTPGTARAPSAASTASTPGTASTAKPTFNMFAGAGVPTATSTSSTATTALSTASTQSTALNTTTTAKPTFNMFAGAGIPTAKPAEKPVTNSVMASSPNARATSEVTNVNTSPGGVVNVNTQTGGVVSINTSNVARNIGGGVQHMGTVAPISSYSGPARVTSVSSAVPISNVAGGGSVTNNAGSLITNTTTTSRATNVMATQATPSVSNFVATTQNEAPIARIPVTDVTKTTSVDPKPAPERTRTTDVANNILGKTASVGGNRVVSTPRLDDVPSSMNDGNMGLLNLGII